jgi:hypothetical protein
MKLAAKSDEIRWQVLKAMLDEFPLLKVKTLEYLKDCEPRNDFKTISSETKKIFWDKPTRKVED